MKGFEVQFRGQTVEIVADEFAIFSIVVQKIRGKIDMGVRGRPYGWLDANTNTCFVWMFADDLKPGDEIIIERKEAGQSSKPLPPPLDYNPDQPFTSEQIQEMRQQQLQYFRRLEEVLLKEGLIEEMDTI